MYTELMNEEMKKMLGLHSNVDMEKHEVSTDHNEADLGTSDSSN